MADYLKESCKDFLIEILNTCKQIESKNKLDKIEDFSLQFKNNKYYDMQVQTVNNYPDFLIKHENDLRNSRSNSFDAFVIVLSERKGIKEYFKKSVSDRKYDEVINIESTKDIALDFVRVYLEKMQSFNFDKGKFDGIYKEFLRYVDDEISTNYFFSPLYNFESDVVEKKFDSGLVLKLISPTEFKEIARLSMFGTKISDIPSHLWTLSHLVCISLPYSPNFYDDNKQVQGLFDQFLQALRVYDNGDVTLGPVYRKRSSIWKTRTMQVDNELIKQSKNKLSLNKNRIIIFNKLYNNFQKVKLDTDRKFIDIAIDRFAYAASRNSQVDKIVDYVICMEALLLEEAGELTVRISNRAAILLGSNDENREFIWKFMKKSYHFRSGIVHGKENKSFVINTTEYSEREISQKLEMFCRDAIKISLDVISHFKTQKKFMEELDLSLLNKVHMTNLKKAREALSD